MRLAVDTNTLIDNPDLAVHVGTPGRRRMVHLLPVVLREIDDLKRGGKTEQLREAARRADRRLKGLRDSQAIAERAVDLEDDGQERAAYDEWKKLFGNRMTRP